MLYRLKLDHDGVYWGAEETEDREAAAGEVLLDHAPDNPPGRYRWDARAARLEPLPPGQVKLSEEVPTLERSHYEQLVRAHQENWVGFPRPSVDWAVAYERSFGADNGRRFGYFRAAFGLDK